ncbi:MAG TPA: hypothetical protein PKA64_01615 [Myxococcota bacterium]|nr:hypothetical protein [Myxococcota bacterium]
MMGARVFALPLSAAILAAGVLASGCPMPGPSGAGGCSDGGSTSSSSSSGPPPCDLAPAGAPICNTDTCAVDADCARWNGTWCSTDGCADGQGCAVPWQCVPMRPAGEPCDRDAQCCSQVCLPDGTCSPQVVDIEAH